MSASAQAPARLSALAGLGGEWARQGADSVAAALKIISDLTAQEVALLVGMLRERVTLRPAAAGVETAGRMATGITDAGKVLLDLAACESAVIVDGMKEVLGLNPRVAALTDLIPRGIGTIVEMHKRFLDNLGAQVEDFTHSYGEGKPLMMRARAMGMVRRNFENFIETQKAFLDQVAEQVTIATETGKESKAVKKERSKALIQLSREGVEKFIDAQKQLLDMTMDRLEADNKPRMKPTPRTSLAELTRKSVQNFTTAQKSLLDLALRPRLDEKGPAAKPASAKRRARPRKRAAATTA